MDSAWSKAARGVAVAVALTIGSAAGLVSAAGTAAAETHSNCIQFDQDGNVIGLTPNCSQTVVQTGGPTQSSPGVNPCDPTDTGTVTIAISRQVYHINVDGAGDAWDTGTATGTVSFVPDVTTDVSGTGKFTNWFGDEFNANNLVQSSTFNLAVHLSNGQTATMHEVVHVTMTPSGAAMSFDKPTGSCS